MVESTKYVPAGLWKRFLARLVDFVVVLLITLAIGTFFSFLMAVLKPHEFQAYLEYATNYSWDQLRWNTINSDSQYQPGSVFDCRNAQDPQKCLVAEGFIIDQTVAVLVIFVILQVLYFGVLTSSRFQATLGKLLFRLKVVNADSDPPSLLQSATREVIFVLFFLSLSLGIYLTQLQLASGVLEIVLLIDSIKIIVSRKKTALHDDLAYTRVVAIR